jgi:branched-chain amino acid transport system substrate-binding protein
MTPPDYGKGHEKYYRNFLKAGGGGVLGSFGVTADQQDFTAELTKAKALAPDVIYFGGQTPLGVGIRQQMDKLGNRGGVRGSSGIMSDAFIAGPGAL